HRGHLRSSPDLLQVARVTPGERRRPRRRGRRPLDPRSHRRHRRPPGPRRPPPRDLTTHHRDAPPTMKRCDVGLMRTAPTHARHLAPPPPSAPRPPTPPTPRSAHPPPRRPSHHEAMRRRADAHCTAPRPPHRGARSGGCSASRRGAHRECIQNGWMTTAATRCDLAKHSVGVYTQIMRASDRAYARLREEIIDGALEPGTVLGEVEQSARLGISRTPLREALARLVADGLAETSRGRGLLVTAVSLAEAPRLFDLRIALETLAARRAAE